MGALIRWFLRNRVAANLLMVAMLAVGIAAMANVTVRTFPEIATTRLAVSVAFPGASPTEVAQSILTPVEQRLTGVEGIRELQSSAVQGLGTVTAELASGADAQQVKNDIETEVARVTTFPEAAEAPRIVQVEPQELAVELALHGDVSRKTLKALAQRVRDDLTGLEGISQVSLSGVPASQIDIEVRRETLYSHGLGLIDLANRISAQNLDLSSGQLDTGTSTVQVRTLGEASGAAGFADIALFSDDNGATVDLGDLADIRETLSDSAVRATVSGEPAVFIAVNRAGTEQVLSVTSTVLRHVEAELRPSLPAGVAVQVWRNQGDVLQGRINLLAKNGALGAGLILIVLMLVLDLRVAAWVAAGVVVAFTGAFAPMLLFGPTINQLSLFGFILALGIVVDDAIVVGERTFRELESGAGNDAAERAIGTTWQPILFSVSTTILAFVPLLFLPGSSGSFIAPVAAVVIYVLAGSLAESFLILPSHLSHLGRGAPRRFSPRRLAEPLRNRVNGAFERFAGGPLRKAVRLSIRHPLFVIAGGLAIAIATAGVTGGGLVKFVFFPDIEGNFVNAELRLPEGTSDEETLRRAGAFVAAAEQAAERLGEEGLLENVAVRIGFAGSGGDPAAASGSLSGATAQIAAKLRDANSRTTSAADFQSAWRDAVGDVAGAREVLFSASVVGVGAPIVIEISSEDEAARFDAVARLRQALGGRQGVVDIRDDRFSGASEVAVRPKDAAQAYGVTVEQLARTVRAALYGIRVDQFARDREEVDVRLREDYPDLRVSTGGEQEEAGRFGSNLAYNFGLALLAIYAVLALAFGSYLLPAVVLLVIPFGVIGAILGHLLLGLDLTLLSMFGIVGLAGVIINGSLLIVTFMQREEADGTAPRAAIETATLARFRPVVLTTLTTFLGITPLILETSVQARFLVPTAVSLGFGVLFASVLQMLLVPAYASLAESWRRPRPDRSA